MMNFSSFGFALLPKSFDHSFHPDPLFLNLWLRLFHGITGIALIADDMGLGKTIQVRSTRTQGRILPVLLIFAATLSTHILHCTFNVP